jgi:hypothetical protein
MERIWMTTHILTLGRMILHYPVLLIPKQILDPTHLLPCRIALLLLALLPYRDRYVLPCSINVLEDRIAVFVPAIRSHAVKDIVPYAIVRYKEHTIVPHLCGGGHW